jgi:hypothetical protein
MLDTANIIITHQSAQQIEQMLKWWESSASADSIWLAYGGTREEFAKIQWAQKFYLESNRIRTVDPQRDRQSYQEIFQQAARLGFLDGTSYVHLAEFDQIPLQPALNMLQIRVLKRLRADVLGYRLARIDGTNHAHWLSHAHDIVLSCMGFGSFWTTAAFRAVASINEPFPIYLELWMPTIAHHLGFRVRRIDEPAKYNATSGDSSPLIDEATAAGMWNVHPVKTRWNTTTT